MIAMRLSSVAERLDGRLIGEDVSFIGCSIDSRTTSKDNLFIAIPGDRVDGHDFIDAARERGACAAMVERSVDTGQLPVLIIEDARRAMGKLAGIWRGEFDIPVLAVTGSNGKTTVKEMISSILGLNAIVHATKGNLNNDIGVPLTLFGLGKKHQYAVIEMGANHVGEIAWLSQLARPSIALITQCAPAHLEGFGTIDNVARAKSEIFSGLDIDGTAILNADDNYFEYWRDCTAQYKQISFGIKNKADITATELHLNHDSGKTGFVMHISEVAVPVELALVGEHNVLNALAAAASCVAAGITTDEIRTGLERVIPVSGRMQMKFSSQGTRIFDDTYNANPVSLKAGLQVMADIPGKKWLVLGDMGELGDDSVQFHQHAGEMARHYGIEQLFTVGELSRYAVAGFGRGARHFSSVDELIDILTAEIPKDVTLLIKGSRRMAMDNVVNALSGSA